MVPTDFHCNVSSLRNHHQIHIFIWTGKKGRTFAALIQNFLEICSTLNEEFIPAYNTPEGRKAYDDTLRSVNENFPQYIKELEGTADGAKVPFYKLFLLHMDRIITVAAGIENETLPVGCSSICLNQGEQEILGHTEDAISENLNLYYFVSAHIVTDRPQGKWSTTEEKFTSLCYPGHLPGYTMSYNHHGLIFSINTLSATFVQAGRTPRHFLTRALLSAENFSQAVQILKDPGCGAGDGCSVNLKFVNDSDRLFYNIEMGPVVADDMSQLNVAVASPGENLMHCNRYLRLAIPEETGPMRDSSDARLRVLNEYPKALKKSDVIKMLSDQTDSRYTVFQETNIQTIAVGIFDCREKTWSIYSDKANQNEPLIVLPLVFKR
ncbi:uncharacterized protein LOC116173707 isoform X2 [Photinus pyralis]|uniref:uncharacterized protein LOC116173707 isoform X2 n=1 Tax=Photinus pyralis TaxID=7054 RepID=UPI00126710A1|nr:uncharacterized protein LOC116173707 isoform X2 [Photinus pyralis]